MHIVYSPAHIYICFNFDQDTGFLYFNGHEEGQFKLEKYKIERKDAYTFFIKLNARGVPLSFFEIMKSYILAETFDELNGKQTALSLSTHEEINNQLITLLSIGKAGANNSAINNL